MTTRRETISEILSRQFFSILIPIRIILYYDGGVASEEELNLSQELVDRETVKWYQDEAKKIEMEEVKQMLLIRTVYTNLRKELEKCYSVKNQEIQNRKKELLDFDQSQTSIECGNFTSYFQFSPSDWMRNNPSYTLLLPKKTEIAKEKENKKQSKTKRKREDGDENENGKKDENLDGEIKISHVELPRISPIPTIFDLETTLTQPREGKIKVFIRSTHWIQKRSPLRHVQNLECVSDSDSDSKVYMRSEEHTSELQSHSDLVCRLLLEKKKKEQICKW